ncbi:MAG: TonB family protein [Acidobacteriota bacterium]
MRQLRHVMRTLGLIIGFGVLAATTQAQQFKHPGIELYRQGKFDQAITSLEAASKQKEFSNNSDIWNTLGLAYFAKDDIKKSRKAFETAIKIAPNVAAFHGNLSYLYLLTQKMDDSRREAETAIRLDPKDTNAQFVLGRVELSDEKFDEADKYAAKVIEINPASPDGYMLRADILLSKLGKLVGAGWDVRDEIDLLKQANDVLKTGAERSRTHPNHKSIDDESESVGAFYTHYSKEPSDGTAISGAAVPSNVRPLVIIRKPLPTYTDRARASGLSGRVRIAVLFGADGQVRHTLILQSLGSGLDEMALNAARRIEFVPQMVDGKPVSVVKTIEYSFSVY